jgi:hypothetical protein
VPELAATLLALGSSHRQFRLDPIADEVTREGHDAGHDGEHELAGGCRQVEGLAVRC